MKISTICLSTSIAVLMSSCATQYVAPTSGPTAKVRVAIVSDAYFLMVGTYADETCKRGASLGLIGAEDRWVRKGYAESSSLKMLDGVDTPDSKRKERLVVANHPFTITTTAMGPVASGNSGFCNLAMTFTPLVNRQYEVLHTLVGDTCYLNVSELSQMGNAVIRTPVADAKQSMCK